MRVTRLGRAGISVQAKIGRGVQMFNADNMLSSKSRKLVWVWF